MASTLPLLGSHVPLTNALAGAADRGAAVIQVHLSAPQQWKAPKERHDAAELAASPIPIFVHAPYLINASSVRVEQRERSAVALRDQLDAAASIGAAGVVVHGGHPTAGGTLDDAITGWLEVLDRLGPHQVPLLVENTAGGNAAPARNLEGLELLFAAFASGGHRVGLCLDTCHAFAAGLDIATLTSDVLAATGRIDLVHLNNSRDPAGSGRDRHENLTTGLIEPALLVAVAATAGAPCVIETPGDAVGQRGDLEWLRAELEALTASG